MSGSGLPRTEPAALAVVVLTYNGRHLLETLLPSLAAQHFRDFQVVIVDNGSSDGTVECSTSPGRTCASSHLRTT